MLTRRTLLRTAVLALASLLLPRLPERRRTYADAVLATKPVVYEPLFDGVNDSIALWPLWEQTGSLADTFEGQSGTVMAWSGNISHARIRVHALTSEEVAALCKV